MLFASFFKTLIDKEVTVELKNNVQLKGKLHSVDQFLNIKIENVQVIEPHKYPQLIALETCFIRGSVVRYVQLSKNDVDIELLEDATRREHRDSKKM
mmetsp:Transcript_12329/g.22291  ORF Transcript_12329/g.22291 Transcript_12329/m.22291 type:complete len:97 (-) Transcript_12329:656-946(-)